MSPFLFRCERCFYFRILTTKLVERVERELLLIEFSRDALGEELTSNDIAQRELAMDKEFIKLIQIACKADNIPRAIELTKLLHHTLSFDSAIAIAKFYHLVGFKEKIELLKHDREDSEDRLDLARDKRRRWMKPDLPPRQLPSGVTPTFVTKPFQNYDPPPAMHRPGLARPEPRVVTTKYSNAALNGSADFSSLSGSPIMQSTSTSFSASPDGKRKRNDVEESAIDADPKRRALGDSDIAELPPPKTSESV